MSIANYEDLKNDFATLTKRTDTADYVDTLMNLAEKRIANDLRVQTMEANIELVCNEEFEALPNDFLVPTRIGDETPDSNGDFLHYRIIGNTLRCDPIAGSNNIVNVDIDYYAKPSALVDNSDTHATLVAHSNVYIAALLLEYAIFKEDEKLINTRTLYYQDAITQANDTANKIKYPGGSLQVRNS